MSKGKRTIKKEGKKLKVLIVVIIAIIILGLSCYIIINHKSNSLLSGKLLNGYSLYESDNYTIQYKGDWTSSISDTYPNTRIFTSPDKSGIINVITEQVTKEYTLDKFIDDSINALASNFNLVPSDISKEKIWVNGTDAYRISYKINETTRITQTIFLSNLTAYTISYNSSVKYFDVYHNMENTLKMKSNNA
ncbi:MAG: hypothetical protein FWC53_00515 [Firmicutes bacterium]|nr:hypothetical protein [Bacillota bacterium]